MTMTELQPKAWGATRQTHSSRYYSRHELQLEAGGYTSFHWHRQRSQSIQCLSGVIEVATLFGPQLHIERLTAGNLLETPPLVVHQFRVIEDGAAIEEYFPGWHAALVLDDDIVRLMVGGKLSTAGCPGSFEELLPELLRQHQ
jgi:mannose-6-phosphate isomerase-like protein (cupin superfamily)